MATRTIEQTSTCIETFNKTNIIINIINPKEQ